MELFVKVDEVLNDVILLWQPPLKQTFRRKDFTAKKRYFSQFFVFYLRGGHFVKKCANRQTFDTIRAKRFL